VTNTTGSATGTGPVTVNAGTLSGTGTIAGAVTVVSSGSDAILAPGIGKKVGALTIQGSLTLGANSDYRVDLDTSPNLTSDSVKAFGVTIDPSSFISFTDSRFGDPPPGTVFTLINNTGATPIAGAFGDLEEGGTIGIDNHNYLATYHGGDGNDLTLTVVP
jgi:hypothetical protein